MFSKKIALSVSAITLVGVTLTGCGTDNHHSKGSGPGASGNQTNATESKTVTIGWLGWTEDIAISYLWQQILQNKGYTVNLKQLDPGPLFVGLSQPNNIDVFLDTWLPVDSVYTKKYKAQLKDIGIWYTGSSSEGIAVPDYMKNINTMQDLNQHASEFQSKIVGIEAGSEEMAQTKDLIKQYGLTNIKLQSSSTPAMLSALKKAYDKKAPIAVVMWTPHWAFTKYHLKYLKDPKNILAGASELHIEANKSWASSNPTVAGWLDNFSLNANELGTLEVDVKNAKSKQDGAKKWIQDNQSLVNSWLK